MKALRALLRSAPACRDAASARYKLRRMGAKKEGRKKKKFSQSIWPEVESSSGSRVWLMVFKMKQRRVI